MADHASAAADYPVKQCPTRFQVMWAAVAMGLGTFAYVFILTKATVLPWIKTYVWPLFDIL